MMLRWEEEEWTQIKWNLRFNVLAHHLGVEYMYVNCIKMCIHVCMQFFCFCFFFFLFFCLFLFLCLIMLLRLICNSWPQAIVLPRPPQDTGITGVSQYTQPLEDFFWLTVCSRGPSGKMGERGKGQPQPVGTGRTCEYPPRKRMMIPQKHTCGALGPLPKQEARLCAPLLLLAFSSTWRCHLPCPWTPRKLPRRPGSGRSPAGPQGTKSVGLAFLLAGRRKH